MFSLRRPLAICALWTLLWAAPTWAGTVVVAKRIDMPGVSLQDVHAQLTPGATPDTVQVSLRVGKADIPGFGWRKVGIVMDGNLHRDTQMRWMFDGTMQLSGAPGGALGNATVSMAVDASANTLAVNASQGAVQVSTAFPLDQPTHAQISLRNLPAGWVQGLLATVWPARVTAGKLDADLALDLRDEGFQSSGDVTFADLKYATPAGNTAGQGLDGHARFELDTTARPVQLTMNGSVHGGELQFGPVLAKLPAHDVVLDLQASPEHGGLAISHLRMDDADALQLDGALTIDARGNLQKLKLEHFQARFPAAYERYGEPWLDNLVAPNLRIAGQVDGHIDYASETLRDFGFHTEALDVADSTGQWQASGLQGDLDWSEQGEKSTTTLAWNQLVLRQFTTGAVQSRWRSRDGLLSLQAPLELATWKGHTRLTRFDWRPTAKTERIDLAASITGADMAAVSQAFGWTPFAGTLDGDISSAHWTGDRYALDGQLSIKAFGGAAQVDHLAVQQPLGNSPALSGDVTLHQIDLAPLADTFNFGAMTGKLDGTIAGLQLVGGSPVAFKASLLAQSGGRISLRAANNLSVVTGGSPASGLQSAMMRLFKTASYKRMGINVALQSGICTLSGLDGEASGYSIVEGSGLPYLHVTGTQNRIEWPLLIRRLKTATQGTVADR
ncbi:DUF748 domain-containing protein [Dyella nitratireducens]|uniref:AsmA-like C-terminal domain-containing protein n=1 Tax=Dyella nitratireducens TaxID=1849580 RepID=A0ABQ1FJ63_9GAMM|nr:DUF748 domain-containing protein [Dyella nitratireducens]GGA17363.1 hypothetical protein GCM10010981_01400 [Dyella nitratireducens]GLQ44799.1 hypothetical protein GCM10007902_46490 [Dyella nitratireducens]